MSTLLLLKLLLGGALIATIGVLGAGLLTMFKHGKEAAAQSNKLMRLRILFQALSLLTLFFLFFFQNRLLQ